MTKTLEELRIEIQAIDIQILKLMKKRLDTAEAIGRVKRESGLDIRDTDVEKKVIERTVRNAEKIGFPTDTAVSVQKMLIKEAINVQEEL